MSATNESDDRDPYIGARVTEQMKRKAEMRARQQGQNMSEYLISLIDDDLSEATYLQQVDF